jgi:tryptophan halogenase
MRVGKYQKVWEKNCIALGLAGSFLEPLESTAIFFTELQLALLVNLFPDKEFSDALINRYNTIFDRSFYEVRDFLIIHYILSKRDDTPFWNHVRSETVIPNSLSEKLEFFKEQLPSMAGLSLDVFPPQSWTSILAGMGYLPTKSTPIYQHLNHRFIKEYEVKRTEMWSQVISTSRSHLSTLELLYSGLESR